jgi:hypothetical protein
VNYRNPEQTLAMMQRVRNGKRRHFLFSIVCLLFGTALYLLPYRHDIFLIPLSAVRYVGAALAITYVIVVVFFGICLFTRIWENICDARIKRFQAACGMTGRDEGVDV